MFYKAEADKHRFCLEKKKGVWQVENDGDALYDISSLTHKLNKDTRQLYYEDVANMVDEKVTVYLLNEGIIEPAEIQLLDDEEYGLGSRALQSWVTIKILNDIASKESKYLPKPMTRDTGNPDRDELVKALCKIYGDYDMENHMTIFCDAFYSTIDNEANPYFLSDVLDVLGVPSWKEKPHILAEMIDGLYLEPVLDSKYITKKLLRPPVGASYLVSKYHLLGEDGFQEWIKEGSYTSGRIWDHIPGSPLSTHIADGTREVEFLLDDYLVSETNMSIVADMALSAVDEADRVAATEVFVSLHNYIREGGPLPVVFGGPREAARGYYGHMLPLRKVPNAKDKAARFDDKIRHRLL